MPRKSALYPVAYTTDIGHGSMRVQRGFNVWDPAWTKQEAYLKNKSAWKHLKGVQK